MGGPPKEEPPADGSPPPPPTPADPIPLSLLDDFTKAVNATTDFLLDGELPRIQPPPPKDASRGIGATKRPIDAELWRNLLIVASLVIQASEGSPDLQSLTFDPMTIATSDGMRTVTGLLGQIAGSDVAKKAVAPIIEKAKAGMQGPEEEASEPVDDATEEAAEPPPTA